MAQTEYLKQILAAVSGNIEDLPDNLKSTIYTAIILKCGGTVDDLPDRLESTYLKRIAECVSGNGGGDNWYNTFWDEFQKDSYNRVGYRYDYTYAFCGMSAWKDSIYNPKYGFGKWVTAVINGVETQVQRCETINQMFQQSQITDTKQLIDVTDTPYPKNASNVFAYCNKLKTIRKITVDDRVTFSGWFQNCTALENIEFGGTIGQDINFQWSTKLTLDSLKNILSTLKDFTGTGAEFSKTINLSAESKAILANAGAIFENNTLTAEEYVTLKKWNY